ncbi:MAG TPA: hypothetical protein VN366_02260 [Feifaniaceae bacterium]|nr:hypothetical protein [Feifaniaceae bacterium]
MNRKPVPFPPAAFEGETMPNAPAQPGMAQQPGMAPQTDMTQQPGPAAAPALPADGRRLDYEGLRAELNNLLRQGRLPAGFDLAAAVQDHVFLRLLFELPAYAAVRVYEAERRAVQAEQAAMQNIISRLQARQGLPRPSRADAAAPSRDYMSMSPEEFARLERDYRDKARKGIKVKL